MSVLRRPSLVGLTSAQEAARQAYEMAGVGAADVEVAEVHDCFTIAEIMAYEDLGFFAKGEGAPFIEEKWWFGQGALRQPEAQSNLTTRGFTKSRPARAIDLAAAAAAHHSASKGRALTRALTDQRGPGLLAARHRISSAIILRVSASATRLRIISVRAATKTINRSTEM